jgi:hypothetical protein
MHLNIEHSPASTKEKSKPKIIFYCVGIDLLSEALEGLPGFDPEVKLAIMDRAVH